MISDIRLIEFSEATFAAIMAHARRSYPDECCGALLGREKTRRRAVESIIEIDNGTTENRGRRFSVAPGDYLRAEQEADSRGLILLGFYHSHPDHPASPSETDRRFAQPGFSYPIVSVTADGVAEVRSWRVRDAWYEEERVRRVPETSATSNTSND